LIAARDLEVLNSVGGRGAAFPSCGGWKGGEEKTYRIQEGIGTFKLGTGSGRKSRERTNNFLSMQPRAAHSGGGQDQPLRFPTTRSGILKKILSEVKKRETRVFGGTKGSQKKKCFP